MSSLRVVLALALGPWVAGCSTTYTPAAGPHLSYGMDGGKLTYKRDGRSFDHGFLGGGLVDAVQGVPAAENAARTYNTRLTGGFAASLVGAACAVAFPIVLASELDRPAQSSRSSGALFTGVLLCTVGGLVSGSVLLATAAPYQFDAVNIYNDEIDRRMGAPWMQPSQWAPPALTPLPPPWVPLPPSSAPPSLPPPGPSPG